MLQSREGQAAPIRDLQESLSAIEGGCWPPNQTIDLRGQYIRDEGAKKIAEALKSSHQDIHRTRGLSINLNTNLIGGAGMRDLAEALKCSLCPQILKIDLSFNPTGDEGAKELAEVIKSGHYPQCLRIILRVNNIGAAGAKYLAEALKSSVCSYGLWIDLAYNDFGAEGAEALAKAMLSNTSADVKIAGYYLPVGDILVKYHKIIEFCNRRNGLIVLHPDFEPFIKEMSYRAGMYVPRDGLKTPLTLKCLSGSAFLNTKKPIPQSRDLPADLVAYLEELGELNNELRQLSLR